jgi:hypothetical protein
MASKDVTKPDSAHTTTDHDELSGGLIKSLLDEVRQLRKQHEELVEVMQKVLSKDNDTQEEGEKAASSHRPRRTDIKVGEPVPLDAGLPDTNKLKNANLLIDWLMGNPLLRKLGVLTVARPGIRINDMSSPATPEMLSDVVRKIYSAPEPEASHIQLQAVLNFGAYVSFTFRSGKKLAVKNVFHTFEYDSSLGEPKVRYDSQSRSPFMVVFHLQVCDSVHGIY